MSARTLVTRILLTAKDETAGVLTSFQAKAAAVGAAVAGYFSFDLLRGMVRSAADFEAQMSRVQAATGATGAELQSLKKAAEDAGASTRFTSVEAGQALENLAKSGLNAAQSIAALPGVLALAEAGDMDLAESASIVTRTIAGMGIAAEETGRIADVLAKGANASNTSVKGLGDALSYAAPTAKSLGLSLEQTVSYIGKFADAGIDASRAGTALNAILSQFLDPASKFRNELYAINITTGNFDTALKQLAKSGKDGEKAILAVGTEAGPALRGLLNQGVGALENLQAQLKGAAGSAAETADIMGRNLNGALSGLSSAWDAFKQKVGEPALNVLTASVKELSAALSGAVSSGLATRYGEALASAFKGGIDWVRRFSDQVDPQALAARLTEGAQRIGALFDQIAESSRNAGAVVQTGFGVMSAGINVVWSGLLRLGQGWAEVVARLLDGVGALSAGLAKVTFGGVSEKFKAMAEEVKGAAGGMHAVADEYGRRAGEAFDATLSGAEQAAAGWSKLSRASSGAAEGVAEVGSKSGAAQTAVASLGQESEKSAAAAEQLGKKSADAGAAQQQSAQAAREEVVKLRAEYEKLMDAGDTQGAAKKLQEIEKALAGVRAEAGVTKDQISAAYKALGMQTQEELTKAADAYRRHYEAIRADGTASAGMLAEAFKQYAEKAIAANKGVAPSALLGEAALRGVRIEADETGKSIVKIGTASAAAAGAVQSSMTSAGNAVSSMRSQAERLADTLERVKNQKLGDTFGGQAGAGQTFEDLRRAGITPEQMKGMGYNQREIEDYVNNNDRAQPGYTNRTVATTATDNYKVGVQLGLSADEAKVFAERLSYETERANAEARSRAGATLGLGFGAKEYGDLQKEAQDRALEYARANTNKGTVAAATAAVGPGNFLGGARETIRIELVTPRGVELIDVANRAQADALVRALQQAKGASA